MSLERRRWLLKLRGWVYETTNEMTPLYLKLIDLSSFWRCRWPSLWRFSPPLLLRSVCPFLVQLHLCSPMIPRLVSFCIPLPETIYPTYGKLKTRVEKRRSKSRVCILFNLHFCCGQYSETHLEIYLCVMCMHIFSNNHCIPTSHHNPNSCVSFLVSNVLVLFIEIVLECLAYSRKFLEFSVVMMKIQRLLLFL